MTAEPTTPSTGDAATDPIRVAVIGGDPLDLGVVAEDHRRRRGPAWVELGGEDPGVVTGDPGAQPGGADTAAGAELRHRPAARRGEGGQQPARLVAAERRVARASRDVEGAGDDLGQLRGCAHDSILTPRVSHPKTSVSHRERLGIFDCGGRPRVVPWSHHAERVRTY